jgi:hypothetical protein
MAYDVTFTIPERVLGRADIEFKVRHDDAPLGTLKVSNGSAVWVPANKRYGFRMGWKQFDDLMRQHGESERG